MQRNRTWKLATGLMVLMLLATPFLAFVPSEVSAVTTGNKLSIIVYDKGNGNPVVEATVTLIGVHQQSAIPSKTTVSGGLAEFTPGDGYYRLVVSKDGYYNYESGDESGEIIRFTDLEAKTIFAPMEKMSEDKYTLSLQVNDTSGGLSGADVKIKTVRDNITTTISRKADSTGVVTLQLPNGTYSVVVSKLNYTTRVQDVTINGMDISETITLSPSVRYSGFVTVSGAPATGVVAYLVCSNSFADKEKIIKASGVSPYFSFDAYVGNFTLLVDADGALAMVENVTINATNPVKTIALSKQSVQTETNHFEFGDEDWNTAMLTKSLVLDHDNTVPGLPYAELPSARMQIDLVFGDGDGAVNESEAAKFEAKMEAFGPIDVTTIGMLAVGAQSLVSADADPEYTITSMEGPVTSNAQFRVEMVAGYTTTIEPVANGLSSYTVKVNALKTSANMSYTYALAFPDLYEKVGSATISPASSGATVSGYTTVTIASGAAAQAEVTLTIQSSVAPTAAAAIVTGADAYKVLNGSTLLHYIVAQDANVTFTASGSSDPNGNPLIYIWNFGDGNSSGEISNVTYVFAYADAKQYTVNLTVKDQAGLMAYKAFTVKVDGVPPTVVAKENVTVLGSTLNVDQNKAYTFNSADSYDRLNSSEEAGLIASYVWDWGDGNSTTVLMGENQTVTHTWTKAGTFQMYLNVTDVANHTTSKPVAVSVRDTVPPTVKFSIKLNGTVVTSAKENQTLTFDASASSDASGIASYLWEFGDGTNSTLASPTHKYQAIKTFTVKLTLTDSAGNSANTTYSLVVGSSARPDLRVGTVDFEPDRFTEGEAGYIYVNVTNVGTARAEGIYAQLWKLNLDGTRTGLTEEGVLLVNGTEAYYLEVGETGVLRFKHTFGSKGDYTLQVNVSASNEVSSKLTDNSATVSLTVEEAGWKTWLLYGGIFAVIIVVVVLFLFRKRLPKISGKKKAPAPPAKRK